MLLNFFWQHVMMDGAANCMRTCWNHSMFSTVLPILLMTTDSMSQIPDLQMFLQKCRSIVTTLQSALQRVSDWRWALQCCWLLLSYISCATILNEILTISVGLTIQVCQSVILLSEWVSSFLTAHQHKSCWVHQKVSRDSGVIRKFSAYHVRVCSDTTRSNGQHEEGLYGQRFHTEQVVPILIYLI